MTSHDTHLLETIAVALVAALAGGFLARRLRLSPIVGYLVAGVAIGPFTPGLVADTEVATELAELGVILLMFGVGIHFSIRDLLAVRSIAVPGAAIQIAVATVLGVALGVALGWGLAGGLVLGLAVSVASTVVLLRALMERNELNTEQGRIAVGWLVVEDLFTIAVLVLLPAVTPLLLGSVITDPARPLADIAVALVKVAAFAVVMLVVGARVVPAVLALVARQGSRELFMVAVLAIGIGIAFSASAVFGVSFALGAFLAGAVLSDSDTSHQAAAEALPLRDAFAVLFFVSVGMLLDPQFLLAHLPAVVAVAALIIVAKSVTAFAITVAFRYPVRTALTIAMALAQIGEFSFIVATLGLSLGLIPADAYQLVVAGALVSISLNPYAFRLIGPLERWLHAGVLARLLPDVTRDLEAVPEVAEPLHGHAVLCGYGRIGRIVAGALDRRGFRYAVITDDHREVARLRAAGVHALYGDPANVDLLEAAHVDRARVVIVAVPERRTAHLVVDRVRELAPSIALVVGAAAEDDAQLLRRVSTAVQPIVASREVAAQMLRASLRGAGLRPADVEAMAQEVRHGGDGDGDNPARAPDLLRGTAARLRAWRPWVDREHAVARSPDPVSVRPEA